VSFAVNKQCSQKNTSPIGSARSCYFLLKKPDCFWSSKQWLSKVTAVAFRPLLCWPNKILGCCCGTDGVIIPIIALLRAIYWSNDSPWVSNVVKLGNLCISFHTSWSEKMFKTEVDMRTPFSDLNFATVQQEASWYLTRDPTDGSNLLFFVASARFLSALRQGFFEPTCYMAAGLAYAYYHLRCWRHEFCLEHNKAKWFNSNELAMQ